MHNIIKQLMEEHDKISMFLNDFELELLTFMDHDDFELKTYEEAISFIREFADKTHHQREEEILFRYMIDYGGKAAKTLVQQGMLVEHDQARFYVKELETASKRYAENKTSIDKLTILSYGKAYIELLRRHIDKENNMVYPFSEKVLHEEHFQQMEQENLKF